jgi:hypothetical protein
MLDTIQETMIYAITAAWTISAVAAYKFRTMFGGNTGWTLVMVGSILFLARLLLKYYPGYSDSETALRFMIGAVAGAVLAVAFYKLYKEAKSLTSF